MDIGTLQEISSEAIYVLVMVSAPILIISLVVGLVVSIFQALTQIQEQTLTFVPKILAIYTSMLMLAPYMVSKLQIFTDHIIQRIILPT